MGSAALKVAVVALSLAAGGCTAHDTRSSGRTAAAKAAGPVENVEPSTDPNGASCLERGLTVFCDDVFTGPNRVSLRVEPTAARPGQQVRVSGATDCGDGTLTVGYTTPTGKSVPVRLTWTDAKHGLSAFSGVFVAPHIRPGIIDIGALAFCLDASYQNSASTTFTVLNER